MQVVILPMPLRMAQFIFVMKAGPVGLQDEDLAEEMR